MFLHIYSRKSWYKFFNFVGNVIPRDLKVFTRQCVTGPQFLCRNVQLKTTRSGSQEIQDFKLSKREHQRQLNNGANLMNMSPISIVNMLKMRAINHSHKGLYVD